MAKVEIRPMRKAHMRFTIVGTSPLITHAWPEKAKEMMRQKHAGKKTKNREIRNTQEEAANAAYRTDDGKFGVPGMAIKSALITAAHKDLGIEKTLVKKALFLVTTDSGMILPLVDQDQPEMREDPVRVGQGSADLRYRPMWKKWRVTVEFEVDVDLMTEKDVAMLVDRAGFGVGIGEWRPEKEGEFGRFKVSLTDPFEVEECDA